MVSTQTIRCIVLSDTHDLEDAFPDSAAKADVVLHCGDMTQIGGLSNYRRVLEQIQALKRHADAELALVIAGNHDVFLDPAWWAENLIEDEDDPEEPLQAKALFDQAKSDNVHLLDEGTHTFTLRDGRTFTIFASPYTPAFGGYAFAYDEDEDHFNTGASTIPEGVDIVMTHGPPSPASDSDQANFFLDIGHEGQHCGCPKLLKAIRRTKPALHCFGHIHEGYGAQGLVHEGEPEAASAAASGSGSGSAAAAAGVEEGFGELKKEGIFKAGAGRVETLLLNAAIQTHEEGPNKPWVVDVELSCQ